MATSGKQMKKTGLNMKSESAPSRLILIGLAYFAHDYIYFMFKDICNENNTVKPDIPSQSRINSQMSTSKQIEAAACSIVRRK